MKGEGRVVRGRGGEERREGEKRGGEGRGPTQMLEPGPPVTLVRYGTFDTAHSSDRNTV